ncbi:proton-conducting transporter membrane subunit [Natronospirillum operosum]|nr:proton-conducting transporter membrane subunit [Natronospirillum operosum]
MAWLWLLVPLTPLLLILPTLYWQRATRWIWLAPLPAGVLALLQPDSLRLPGLWPGARWGLPDDTALALLVFTAGLWLLAGLFAVWNQAADSRRRRFWLFWLLALSGNLLLLIAQDGASFYVGFTLMSLSAFGLVIHSGKTEARRAGRLYLQLAIMGELLLFMGLMLRVHEAGGDMELAAWQGTPIGTATLICLLLGFGLKAGFWPLHIWLPAAHPAAPPAASAVLSGAMIKAGILGLSRFLPESSELIGGWLPLLAGIGLISAFFGVVVGLLQRRDKTVLAYSSVSQVGYLLFVLTLVLTADTPALAGLLLMLYVVHHGLAKGALFLGAGLVHEQRLPRWGWALMALPALALAGLPLTSGGAVKTLLKDQVEQAGMAQLIGVLTLGSASTLLLVSRALWLMWHSQPATRPTAPRLPVWLSWGLLCIAPVLLPWLWPELRQAMLNSLSIYASWALLWPLLLATLLMAVVIRFRVYRYWQHLRLPQPGLRFSLWARRWLQTRPLSADAPSLSAQMSTTVRLRALERRWNRLGEDVVSVSVWVIALAVLWLLI